MNTYAIVSMISAGSMNSLGSKLLFGFLVLLLAGTGAFGLVTGTRGLIRAASSWEVAVAISDLGFGVSGFSAAALLALRKPGALWAIATWASFATFSSTLVPVVLEGSSIFAGIAAGAATALLAVAVLWASTDFATRSGST